MLYFELNSKAKWKLNNEDLTRIFKIASRVLNEKQKEDKVISLVTVSRREMRLLNKTTRKIDAPTDILTFSLEDKNIFLSPPFVRAFVGEMVICPAVAKEKAVKLKQSEEAYERFLVVHGILHVFGMDHKEDSDSLKMEKIEQKILTI